MRNEKRRKEVKKCIQDNEVKEVKRRERERRCEKHKGKGGREGGRR